MWHAAEAAVRVGSSDEILVCLDGAPTDLDEVIKELESLFIFDSVRFTGDTDDAGVDHQWIVLMGAREL